MDFSTVNWLAVIVAAVAAWLFGAAWYMGLSKPWLKAAKLDPAAMRRSFAPFIISFIAELIMALIMTLVIGAITGGEPNPVAGVIFGSSCGWASSPPRFRSITAIRASAGT